MASHLDFVSFLSSKRLAMTLFPFLKPSPSDMLALRDTW